MGNVGKIENLEVLNEKVGEIFGIEQIKHIGFRNEISKSKIIEIRFNLSQKDENPDNIILSLLNLYIVPAFVLPSGRKNKDVSVTIGTLQKSFIAKRYTKDNDVYIESKQLEQQNSNRSLFKRVLNQTKIFVQNLAGGKEEIELIEINKGDLDLFKIDNNESIAVKITFANIEINIQHIESILSCISSFKESINKEAIKPLIEIDYSHQAQDKLNIYPFFAKKTVRSLFDDDVNNNDNIKSQETILCLTTKQNDVGLVSSIFRDNASQFKIKCKEGEYSLLSYSLANPFSQNLVDFLQFFNDPSCNEKAKISNLQRIEKTFSEDIKIKDGQEDKEENSSNKAKIRIENAACFTSSLQYENGCLQLKKSKAEEKIYFNFEVKIENSLGQIEKESRFIYDSVIYKIVSLISFFALCLKEDKFSLFVEVDGKNIFSIETDSYSKLVPAICKKLKDYTISLIEPKNYTNFKLPHMQVLDLFHTKKVSFKLEAETRKIAIDRLEYIKNLMGGVSILDSYRKEFLDNIGNPSVHCYLSNFFYKENNLTCVYVNTHQENLKINGQSLDKNSEINFLKDEFQKSFDRISSNSIQTKDEGKFLTHSIDIDTKKLLNQHTNKSQEEEVIEATEEIEITEEKAKIAPQEYDVDWQEECLVKITPANDYTSLELGLKKACKFMHYRILHVCGSLLEKIDTLQLGKEQRAAQDDQLPMNESTIKTTLDKNINHLYSFVEEKRKEFYIIKSSLDEVQRRTIASIGNDILKAVQSYKEIVNLHLVINNATDLSKTLEENIEQLEQLMSKVDQLIVKANILVEQPKQSDGMAQPIETDSATTYEAEKDLPCKEDIDVLENNNLPQTSGYGQTSYIEENGEDKNIIINIEENSYSESQVESDKEQENRTTSKDIFALFSKLNKKSIEWYNLETESWLISSINQGFGESKGEDDFDPSKSIITSEIDASSPQKYTHWDEQVNSFLHQFKSKIQKCINLKRQNFDKEQIEVVTLEQYKQMLNLVNDIFYGAKTLHHYKIQNGFEKLEKETRKIESITNHYLSEELDKKEEELERREAQLKQTINIRKIGNDTIVSTTQSIVSLYKKVKNKISNPQPQPQNDNIYSANTSDGSYASNPSPSNYNTHNYQQSNYNQCNIEVTSQLINPITDSAYSHKRSNFQKLKIGIKDTFSEKESYLFLTFSILGIAGILAYFIPEGLRKFVPSEELKTIDITVATGATILIVIGFVALVYSVYASIVHSNMIDSITSLHSTQNQPVHNSENTV